MAAQDHLSPEQFPVRYFEGHMRPGELVPTEPDDSLDQRKIGRLERSIRAEGVHEPLIVNAAEHVKVGEGHHRRAAAINAGLESVPVVVRSFTGDSPPALMKGRELTADEFVRRAYR